jgi:hypothetical protein
MAETDNKAPSQAGRLTRVEQGQAAMSAALSELERELKELTGALKDLAGNGVDVPTISSGDVDTIVGEAVREPLERIRAMESGLEGMGARLDDMENTWDLRGIDVPDPASVYMAMATAYRLLRPVIRGGQAKAAEGGSYAYRRIDDLMTAVQDAIAQAGVVIVGETVERISSVRKSRADKDLNVTILNRQWTISGPDGSSIVADTWGEGVDGGDKSTSKAHTMARKAMYEDVFHVPFSDLVDPDSEHVEGTPAATPAGEPEEMPDGTGRIHKWRGFNEGIRRDLLKVLYLDYTKLDTPARETVMGLAGELAREAGIKMTWDNMPKAAHDDLRVLVDNLRRNPGTAEQASQPESDTAGE